jgi:hypothetical protein
VLVEFAERRSWDVAEDSQGRLVKVSAWRRRALGILVSKLTRMYRGSAQRVVAVNEFHRIPHVVWGVPHVSSKQVACMTGQEVGGGADGPHDKPERNAFLVNLREPVQCRRPRTLCAYLLDDLRT